MKLITELRERRVLQWLVAYVGAAWSAVQAASVLAPQLDWPSHSEKLLTYVLAAGLVPATILAWIHGKKGLQRFSSREIVLLGAVLIAVAVGIVLINSRVKNQATEAFLYSAHIELISVEPPPGTILQTDSLVQGVPVVVTIEHSFFADQSILESGGVEKPFIHLFTVLEGDIDKFSLILRSLAEEESTWTTRQIALRGVMYDSDVDGGKIKLVVTMMAAWQLDSDGERKTGPLGERVVVEYPVEVAGKK